MNKIILCENKSIFNEVKDTLISNGFKYSAVVDPYEKLFLNPEMAVTIHIVDRIFTWWYDFLSTKRWDGHNWVIENKIIIYANEILGGKYGIQ